jgi:hypothetical protein
VSHAIWQAPPWQAGLPWAVGGHWLPHAPQLAGSRIVSAQAAPQALPAGHVKPHAPWVQVAVPPGGAVHVAPQPLQLAGSFERVTHVSLHVVSPSAQVQWSAAGWTQPASLEPSDASWSEPPVPPPVPPGRTQVSVAASHT